MKKILLALFAAFSLTFSSFALSSEHHSIRGTDYDFDYFPLSTSNAHMLEGRWAGNLMTVDLKIADYTFNDRPVFFLDFTKIADGNSRSGLLYYSANLENYTIQVLDHANFVEVDFMVAYFEDKKSIIDFSCTPRGGAVFTLEFNLEGEKESVDFFKSYCF